MNTDRITEHLRSLAPWALARMAECFDPDTEDSPGARFLALVRDSVIEDWDRLTDNGLDAGRAVSGIANACIPSGTHETWTTFVDLGAYRQDVTGYHPVGVFDTAVTALYVIAERLVYALVEEGKELDDEEEDN